MFFILSLMLVKEFFLSKLIRTVIINAKRPCDIIILMNKVAETSQFYGVEVSQYNIDSLKSKQIQPNVLAKINQGNAHIIAYALQSGNQQPSDSSINKTVTKNNKAVDKNVNAYANYYYRSYLNVVFKKPNKHKGVVGKPQKKKAFQVHSPQQIVIKCARAAYIRQILLKDKPIVQNVKREISQSAKKRKQHQKERRNERKLIIKAYKVALLRAYGNIIFSRGWKISRNQLKNCLKLPQESYKIVRMKNIIKQRQRIGAIIYAQKKKAYQKQKLWRLQALNLERLQQKKNRRVPQSIRHYREENWYEKKQDYLIKEKIAKGEATIFQKKRNRKMRKEKLFYRQRNYPGNKQILKQAKRSTSAPQDEEEFDQIENMHQVPIKQKGTQVQQ